MCLRLAWVAPLGRFDSAVVTGRVRRVRFPLGDACTKPLQRRIVGGVLDMITGAAASVAGSPIHHRTGGTWSAAANDRENRDVLLMGGR